MKQSHERDSKQLGSINTPLLGFLSGRTHDCVPCSLKVGWFLFPSPAENTLGEHFWPSCPWGLSPQGAHLMTESGEGVWCSWTAPSCLALFLSTGWTRLPSAGCPPCVSTGQPPPRGEGWERGAWESKGKVHFGLCFKLQPSIKFCERQSLYFNVYLNCYELLKWFPIQRRGWLISPQNLNSS